MIYKNKKLDW